MRAKASGDWDQGGEAATALIYHRCSSTVVRGFKRSACVGKRLRRVVIRPAVPTRSHGPFTGPLSPSHPPLLLILPLPKV